MEEKELLEWINERIVETSGFITKISIHGQAMSLTMEETDLYLGWCRDITVLNDLKGVVINWYQGRKAMKEG